MYYSDLQIVLQEVPGEVSICFTITGCKIQCKGCHSPYLWKEGSGKLLTESFFKTVLKKYHGFASCVLFMGGEWHRNKLISYFEYAKAEGYNTCLYTGEEEIDSELSSQLTWLKSGKWDRKKFMGTLCC